MTLIGINGPQTFSYQTHLSSPDIITQGLLCHVDSFQRVLAEDYVPGSNRLVYGRHCDPYLFPNGLLIGDAKIPTPTGTITIPYQRLARHPYLFLSWGSDGDSLTRKAAFEALALKAGHPIDFQPGKWQNNATDPAHWIMNEYVLPDGRRTGFPGAIYSGQRVTFNNIDSGKLPLPGGNWTLTGKGTGTVMLVIGYRDRAEEIQTITFTGGVASGPMVIAGNEFSSLKMILTASDPADPLHDMRNIMPGSWPADLDSRGRGYEGKTFVQIYAEHADDLTFFLPHPAHVIDMRRFTHARVVDAQTTILNVGGGTYHGIVDPSDRALPTFGIGKHDGGEGGATPLEWLVETTDISDQDFYFCSSHEWTDEMVRVACDVIKAKARPRTRILHEYSCETWNPAFGEYYATSVLGSAWFTPRALDSLTYDSGSGKATAHKIGHGYANGDSVQIDGTSESAYNGTYTISGVTADSFQFTPNSTPAHSPALPARMGRPFSFKIGGARTSEVSAFEFKWFDGGPIGYYVSSGYRFVTTSPEVSKGDVVAICNVDGAGVDGFYLVDQPPGYASNEFFINLPFQCLHHPVLDPMTGFTTFGPIAGREIQICVVGSANASAEAIQTSVAMNRWSGYRAGTIFKVIQEEFPDDLDRLTAIVAGFQAIPSFNVERMEGFLEAFGGHLPPISETTLHVATYHEDFSLDQRANFVGDMKPLASLVVSGGVATATIADYPVTLGGSSSTAHNWSTGDTITVQNVNAEAANGKFTITSTGSSTFTFPLPGVSDGSLSGFNRQMFAIKGNVTGIQILSATRSGHDVTYFAPGHPFTVGQQVGVGGLLAPVHENVFTIKAATATSFTVDVNCDFDPTFVYPGRGSAFAASLLSIYPASNRAFIAGDYYNSVLDDLVSVAHQFGATAGIYETGNHFSEQESFRMVPWIGGIIKESVRTPPARDMIFEAIALHASKPIVRYTYLTYTRPWGPGGENFGIKEYEGDTRSQKWVGMLDGIEAYGTRHAPDAPATRFTITPPLSHRIDEEGGYGLLAPDGILESETTAFLSDGGKGGTFNPSVLTFSEGSTSGRAFTYSPATIGWVTLSATILPTLGANPTASLMVLDEDGNPGNATLVVDDDFGRADGSIGNSWIANGSSSAVISDGRLEMDSTSGSQFSQIASVIYRDGLDALDVQIRFRFIANTATGDVGALIRGDGQIGGSANGYGVIASPSTNRVFFRHFHSGVDASFFSPATDAPFVNGREYEVYVRARGTSPTFDVNIKDLTSGSLIFDQSGIPHGGSADPIATAGKVGILINSGPATITRATVSTLAEVVDPDPDPEEPSVKYLVILKS